jgi:DUF917 family protein
MSGHRARAATIGGTMTLAIDLGRAVLNARLNGEDPFAALFSAFADAGRQIEIIFDGKVIEVQRRQEGGWNVGEGTLAGIGEYKGSDIQFRFQNEYLVVQRDGNVVATVPDLICFLDRETGERFCQMCVARKADRG